MYPSPREIFRPEAPEAIFPCLGPITSYSSERANKPKELRRERMGQKDPKGARPIMRIPANKKLLTLLGHRFKLTPTTNRLMSSTTNSK
jgi:hypothetical protein